MSSQPASPEELMKLLRPPKETQEAMRDLPNATGQIINAFAQCLSLPAVDALKIDETDNQVSVSTYLKDLQTRYRGLQDMTISVVKGLGEFSECQQLLLPHINTEVPVETYVAIALPLVQKYARDAAKVAKGTEVIQSECSDFLDALRANLKKVNDDIASLEKNIKDKEAEYSTSKWIAIAKGILGGLLLIAAVILIFNPITFLPAAGVGLAGIAQLASMIDSAIKAGNLKGTIEGLKKLLAECVKTREALNVLIPTFATVVKLLKQVTGIWEGMESQLISIKDSMKDWTKITFNDLMRTATIEAWASISSAVDEYLRITISGFTPTDFPVSAMMALEPMTFEAAKTIVVENAQVQSMFADDFEVKKLEAITSETFVEPPPQYSLVAESLPAGVQYHLAASFGRDLMRILEPPTFDIVPVRLFEIKSLSSLIQDSRQYAHDASVLQVIEAKLRRDIPEVISELLRRMADVASKRPALPQFPVTKTEDGRVSLQRLMLDLETEVLPLESLRRVCSMHIEELYAAVSRALYDLSYRMTDIDQRLQQMSDVLEQVSRVSAIGLFLPIGAVAGLPVLKAKEEIGQLRMQKDQLEFVARTLMMVQEMSERLRAFAGSIEDDIAALGPRGLEILADFNEEPTMEIAAAQASWKAYTSQLAAYLAAV